MQNYLSNQNLVLEEQLNGTNINQFQKKYAQNRYLNHLINRSFQRVNRHFVLSFEIENDRTSHLNYYLPSKSRNKRLQRYG